MGLRPVAAATRMRRDELCTFLQARSLLYSKRAAILGSWNSPHAHSRSGLVLPRSLRLRVRSLSSRGWFSRILNRWRRALHNRSHLLIVQLIHIATLVHDDVMDEAVRRRAQPTANARWGNSLSVLLGDCLFAHALTLSTNFENADISRAIARTAGTVCSGEMIQTQRRFDLNLTVQDYLRIVEMKTGSLFSTAAELAAVISEAEPNVIETFKNFGVQVGTAYQIYDDCVDLAGNESVTGKTLGTDLRKGKFTLPVLIFLRSASEFERQRCCQLVLEEKIEDMIELLKNGANDGALNESIDAGSDLIRGAQIALDGIESNPYADALFSLGDALCEMFDQLRV